MASKPRQSSIEETPHTQTLPEDSTPSTSSSNETTSALLTSNDRERIVDSISEAGIDESESTLNLLEISASIEKNELQIPGILYLAKKKLVFTAGQDGFDLDLINVSLIKVYDKKSNDSTSPAVTEKNSSAQVDSESIADAPFKTSVNFQTSHIRRQTSNQREELNTIPRGIIATTIQNLKNKKNLEERKSQGAIASGSIANAIEKLRLRTGHDEFQQKIPTKISSVIKCKISSSPYLLKIFYHLESGADVCYTICIDSGRDASGFINFLTDKCEFSTIAAEPRTRCSSSFTLVSPGETMRKRWVHHKIVPDTIMQKILVHIPNPTHLHSWKVAYDSIQHFASSQSILERMNEFESPFIILAKTDSNEVFGVFLSVHECHFGEWNDSQCLIFYVTEDSNVIAYSSSPAEPSVVTFHADFMCFEVHSKKARIWIDGSLQKLLAYRGEQLELTNGSQFMIRSLELHCTV